MQKYKTLTRTTLSELDDLPHAGVYVIAYLGKVLYVGKASESVHGRLHNHMYKPSRIGVWMRNAQDDWCNVRLDVLEQPDSAGVEWLDAAELALIRHHAPLFNDALMVEA